MEIRKLEWATFLKKLDGRDFDAVTLGWSLGVETDPYQLWHSSQAEAGSNFSGFKNEEADKIIVEVRQTLDLDKRIALLKQFHAILHEEQPYTFLFCPKALLAADKRIHGIKLYPYGPDSTEWFVPATLQRYH